MRISDWSSDVCSSDLIDGDPAVQPPDVVCRLRPRNYDVGIGCIACAGENAFETPFVFRRQPYTGEGRTSISGYRLYGFSFGLPCERSEEHTSELQSLMRISYAVFCLKKQKSNSTSKL